MRSQIQNGCSYFNDPCRLQSLRFHGPKLWPKKTVHVKLPWRRKNVFTLPPPKKKKQTATKMIEDLKTIPWVWPPSRVAIVHPNSNPHSYQWHPGGTTHPNYTFWGMRSNYLPSLRFWREVVTKKNSRGNPKNSKMMVGLDDWKLEVESLNK